MRRISSFVFGSTAVVVACALAVATPSATTQLPLKPVTPQSQSAPVTPLTGTVSPAVLELLTLDGRFSEDVKKGGGRAFAEWFAPDAVTLNNKRAPVMGKSRIAMEANWKPEDYQLSWFPQGGQMGPSNDMGFTWGHYEGKSKDAQGNPVTISGRYITVWKKMPDGKWKVAMDASAEEPPNAGDCCALPKP